MLEPEQVLEEDPLLELSMSEQAKLTSLQQSLLQQGMWNDGKHDLHTLRRFLKARQWDVAGAQQMWMEMLQFRALNNVDSILTDFHFHEREAFLDVYPHGLHKVDKKHRPIIVYKLGSVDLDRLKTVTTDERITLFHIQEYERIMHGVLPACRLVSGRYIEQLFTLIDVGGLKMKDMMRVKDLLTGYIKVDSINYPETLGAMVIINAPYWFTGMFSAVKSFLPPDTQRKVQILGCNYHKELLKLIDPENLLVEYGGKSTGQLRDNIGPWKPVLESVKEATEARQQALDRGALPEDAEDAHVGLSEWSELEQGGWEQQRSSKRHRHAAHAHVTGHYAALPEGVLQPDGSLRPYHAEHTETTFAYEAQLHEHRAGVTASRAHSSGSYANGGGAAHACAASRASSATPPPVDGGALLPQASIAHSCRSSSTGLSPLQGEPLPGSPMLSPQNGHSHHHRHRRSHRHVRNSHHKGNSPRHSLFSTHSSTHSPQQDSGYTDHSQQGASVPELPFSNSPDHAPSMFAGPFGSHLTQRATIEACMSWDAVTASGNSTMGPMNSIALSCYHSLDTEATSALRPTTPSAAHHPHLPVWQEDDPESPSNSASPSAAHAHPTPPLTPQPALGSLHTSSHSLQPYNTSPFSPQPTTAHNALSAIPTAADAHAHASSILPTGSLFATHQHQQQFQLPTLPAHTAWQRPRRSIDTQLPPEEEDRRWLDPQVRRASHAQARRSSERPRARSRGPSRGSSIDGGISAGPRLPTVQTGMLWPHQTHPTHPLATSLSSAASHGLPFTGVQDTDAITESALATMRATRPSAAVTRPSAVGSGILGASMCSACSDGSDSAWVLSSGDPNKGTTSPPFPGSASPSQSYVSVGGLRPSTGGLSPAHSAAPGMRASNAASLSLSPAHSSANPGALLPAGSLHHAHSPPSALTALRPYGSGPLHSNALLFQGSMGAPRHPTSRPSEAPSHDFARMSFHSAGSMDSNSLQYALNSLGGGGGPGGTPIAATDTFPWLDPPAAAASAANVHPHAHAHPHPLQHTVHAYGSSSCRASGSGGVVQDGGSHTPVLSRISSHIEALKGRAMGAGDPASPSAAFAHGQEEQGARPPSRMFSLPHQHAEQAHSSRALQNSSSAGAGASPASRLSNFANGLRMRGWFSKGKENTGDKARKDGSSYSRPLLVLQPQQSGQQRQGKGNKGKQTKWQGGKDGTASYQKVTSNPLVDEGMGDSDKATEWEWDDVKEQDAAEKARGNSSAGHARGVTWAALPPSRVENEGEEEDQRQPLKGCRSRSFGSAMSDISPRQSHGQNWHSHQQHTKKRSSRSAAHNTVLPMGCESSTAGWDGPSPGVSNFGSRRTSNRNSRPSAYQGPRCSSTSWYGSCEDNDGWVLEEKPTVLEDDEGEEGGLLGGGAVARKHSRGQKKPGFGKRLAKKLLPCCGIQ